MKIYLREITEQDTDLDYTQTDKWVADAVENVDERMEETTRLSPVAKPKELRAIRAHFNLRQVDEVVVVSGNIDTHIELICSRCANPFALKTQPSFSALFCKDPDMAGIAHLQQSSGKPIGQNAGWARHAHEDDHGQHAGNLNQDLDITYLSQDFIDLSDVLTEQLRLQIPFQPLCREECKGMCTNCGTDLNSGRCACAKINKASPFSVLNNLKM